MIGESGLFFIRQLKVVDASVSVLEYSILISLALCLSSVMIALTAAFDKVRQIEDLVATPGKGLDEIRRVWGNGPIGRLMRLNWLFGFFTLRYLPVIGPQMKARLGDESPLVPIKLKLWLFIPMSIYLLSGVCFFVLGFVLGYV
ncbi:hypothetical protein BCA33_13690 [Marinobacter sp. AC-23]|nr:hypothetical protein BCA33_13690 [Marinobacter sp. AC-23]